MTIELSNAECEALLDVLERELSSLPVEIHRTEAPDFRKELEAFERDLRAVYDRLAGAAAPS